MRDQRVMAKDRDQQETLADLSPEESGWFSASLKHPRGKAGRGDRRTARGDPHTDGPRSSGGRRLVSVGRYALRGVSAAQELFTLDPSAYQKGPSTYACPCLLIGHDQTCCGPALTAEFGPIAVIEGHHSITSSARRGRGRGRGTPPRWSKTT